MPTQTSDQRQAAFAGAGLSAQDQANVTAGVQNSGVTPSSYADTSSSPPPPLPTPQLSSTINSAALATTPDTNYQQPTTTPPYPVGAINNYSTPPLDPTQPEQQANDLTSVIQSLTNQDANRTADTMAAYKQYGITTTIDANGNVVPDPGTADLQGKLTALQNEALAIPQQLQSNAAGRGITAGGLAPIQAGSLRNNAVAALEVSSVIAAKNGHLITAQHYVDAAMDQKYGTMEKQIAAAKSNLDSILKSPAYSLADKNRAQAQQDILNQKAAALAQQKTDYQAAQTEALKYAGVADAQTLHAMQSATTAVQVAQIAAAVGLQPITAGRYKDNVTTSTDAFGNQTQKTTILDTATGQIVNAPAGTTSAQMNSAGANSGAASSVAAGANGKVSFDQYGLLAKTDFNPANQVDQLAQQYMDRYIKSGTVPLASSLGRGIKPAAFGQVEKRANDLYFAATGNPLPSPKEISGYQAQFNANTKLLNTLGIQEGTVGKNFDMALKNIDANNINGATQPINALVDAAKTLLGDVSLQQFFTQNTTLQQELSNLIAVKNASGTTVHDKITGETLLNANATRDQQYKAIATILQEAKNNIASISDQNGQLLKYTDPFLQNPKNPLRAQAQNQQVVEGLLQKGGYNYDSLVQEMQQSVPDGHQPALDKTTGQPVYATPEEIKTGKYVPL